MSDPFLYPLHAWSYSAQNRESWSHPHETWCYSAWGRNGLCALCVWIGNLVRKNIVELWVWPCFLRDSCVCEDRWPTQDQCNILARKPSDFYLCLFQWHFKIWLCWDGQVLSGFRPIVRHVWRTLLFALHCSYLIDKSFWVLLFYVSRGQSICILIQNLLNPTIIKFDTCRRQ